GAVAGAARGGRVRRGDRRAAAAVAERIPRHAEGRDRAGALADRRPVRQLGDRATLEPGERPAPARVRGPLGLPDPRDELLRQPARRLCADIPPRAELHQDIAVSSMTMSRTPTSSAGTNAASAIRPT